MPLILHIETATEVCSVGLALDGKLLALREESEPYQHASRITRFIEACLDEAGARRADVDAVAVSRGPGSFTALRIGTSAAKGFCFALDKPLLSINTLQALAWGAQRALARKATYCSMIDARRMEVYMACFDEAGTALTPPQALIVEADTFADRLQEGESIVLVGNGAEKCRPLFEQAALTILPLACSAQHMCELAEAAFSDKNTENLAYYEPFYLKPPNITKPKKRL